MAIYISYIIVLLETNLHIKYHWPTTYNYWEMDLTWSLDCEIEVKDKSYMADCHVLVKINLYIKYHSPTTYSYWEMDLSKKT